MPRQKKSKNTRTIEVDEDADAEYAIVPPDGGWGWVVVIGSLYLNTIIDGIFYSFSIFLQDLADYFEADKSKISLIFSILFGCHYGMGVVCAGLSNAFGLRPVTCTGALLAASAFALSSIVKNYAVLYLTYGVMGGIGLGLMITNGIIAPTIYFAKWRGLAISITSLGTGIGAMVFPYIGNHVRKIASWQLAFQVQAIAVATIFLAGLTFRPIKPTRVVTAEDVEKNTTERRRSRVLSLRSSTSEDPRIEAGAAKKVPTMYFKKTLQERGKSTLSLNMPVQVVENVGAQSAFNKLARKKQLKKTGKEGSTESVLFVHPESKQDFFLEDFTPQKKTGPSLMNTRADFRKSRLMSTISIQPSAYVFSKVEPATTRKNLCGPLLDSVKNMLDCRVFKSKAFVLYALCGITTLMGVIIVTAYQPDRAQLQGFDSDTATYFVMTFGAANCIWRLFLGVISVLPNASNLVALVGCTFVGGVSALVSGLNLSLPFQYIWAIGAGLALASFAVHRPVLLVDLVGYDRITPATGIQYMLMGLGAITSPPLSGLVMELTGNYDAPFYMSGTFLIFSACGMSLVHYIRKKELRGREDSADTSF